MKNLFLLIPVVVLFSCNTNKNNYEPITVEKDLIAINNQLEGKKLMETHCYACHNPTTPENGGRIAPPMIAVKTHYLKDGMSKEEFIAEMTSFVENPSEDKVQLRGAFRRFGLMPKQVFPEGAIEKIAAYMYDYQIEEPEWFQEHMRGNKNGKQMGKKLVKNTNPKTSDEIGMELALSTKEILGKNLMQSLQAKGTLEALNFCNIRAIPLTDSMALKHNAIIKRASDKNRNSINKATKKEIEYIEKFKTDLVAQKELKPIVIEKGDMVQFYYPIVTNTMCLQCHGKNIQPEIKKQILKLYPDDLAIGYDENEVRGLWSIRFNKNRN